MIYLFIFMIKIYIIKLKNNLLVLKKKSLNINSIA